MRLIEFSRCFQGVIPTIIASSDAHGMPNVTYVSQVYLIDDQHVALSCQFFNKTRRNLDANPFISAELLDPVTMQAYRLRLKFVRSEKRGPLFETMAMRIQAIASHTGMDGVFRLIAADVFEVLSATRVEGFLNDPGEAPAHEEVSVTGLRTELRGLQLVSERINRADDLETLLAAALDALDVYFGFHHTMVLLYDNDVQRLVTIACRGYGGGVGAEVAVGEGLIGTVASEQRVLRITGLEAGLRYGRAVRRSVMNRSGSVRPEIPLPGLPDAQSALVIPLLIEDRLIGVLAAESRDAMAFGEWDETYLAIIGNQIALGIDRALQDDPAEGAEPRPAPPPPPIPRPATVRRTLTYYRNDDCVFLDGEYLIRNVPGRILWKLLGAWKKDGRTAFTNRELRLDRTLGLPELKDNLESRLILLRHRLREKCPEIQIASTGRGRFALEIGADLDLVEK
ncbi:MAG: GAF domain-containing protein [Acidobacteria bacterium]|nr:GAF domain-containing protein [Acidobacteriota bacterium]MBV9476394.1 GAF domain-containing protein [Acidobacteriota bacterium]